MAKIVGIYKPVGVSSFDIIKKIRKVTGEKKVGHAGTLDPLAEGVLVVGIGREATKKLGKILEQEKEYLVEIELGKISTTDDKEGEKKKINVEKKPSLQEVKKTINSFVGKIKQTPPRFSAVKIKGVPAYKLARLGKEIKLKSKEVFVKEIKILRYNYPFLKLKVRTGKGVYIRALARDIGKRLGTGGYVVKLIRTKVGRFKRENCLRISS